MKITGWHYLVGVLVVLVIFTSALLGVYLGLGGKGYRTIADGIIIKDDGIKHVSVMLTQYTEYIDMLDELGIARDVFLTNGDFDDYDYIIDYIYYDDSLKINEINLELTDDGVIIEYDANKEVKNSDELLIYFIRIEKDSLSEYKFDSRKFKVD